MAFGASDSRRKGVRAMWPETCCGATQSCVFGGKTDVLGGRKWRKNKGGVYLYVSVTERVLVHTTGIGRTKPHAYMW